MSDYEICPDCVSTRASGDLALALTCRGCKGTGIRRKPESYVCNKCGGPMCPETSSPNADIPYGLVNASVSGGYDSTHLSDCTTYTFSMCEGCLRELFESFKIPPALGDYMSGGDWTYAEEAQGYRTRKWVEAGGRATKLGTGICNATEACSNAVTWVQFISGQWSGEAVCDEHKRGYANSEFIPAEDLEGVGVVPSQWDEHTKMVVASMWLIHCGRPAPDVTYWRYAPQCALDAHKGGEPDDWGLIWVPNRATAPEWLTGLEGVDKIRLLGGSMYITTSSLLWALARGRTDVKKAKVLQNLPEETE